MQGSGVLSDQVGYLTQANGIASVAQGISTLANGTASFVAGQSGTVNHDYSIVLSDRNGASSTNTDQLTLNFSNGVAISGSTHISPAGSGTNTIGTPSHTFSTGYFDNILSPVTPKVWVAFNGTGGIGSNQVLYNSYNANRVLKNNNGDFTLFFLNTIQTGYCLLGCGSQDGNVYTVQPFTSTSQSGNSTRFLCNDPTGTAFNKAYVNVIIFGY